MDSVSFFKFLFPYAQSVSAQVISSVRCNHNMDVIKAKAWKDFVAKNTVVAPAYDRIIHEDDNPTPFCISLKSVEGIQVSQLTILLFFSHYDVFFFYIDNVPAHSIME